MRPKPIHWATLAVLPGLVACGSTQSSSPVTVVSVVTTATAPASTPTTTQPPPSAGATTSTTATPTTPTVPPTRTSPAPAFTRTTGGTPAGGDLQRAVAKLSGLGFTPVSTSAYDTNQTLRVLVGARGGSGAGQQAFFFDGPRFLGTDAAAPSGMIAVLGTSDTQVTLRYGIYRPGDPACCPSGSPRTVRFALDGGHLLAVDPIPSTAARR